MVASDSKEASLAAVKILADDGNVVDASIALSFVISVTRPQSTGLGGGGFLLLHLDGKTQAFDFRERAPMLAHKDMYRNEKGEIQSQASLLGWKSVGVPGNIAGLIKIHKQHGKLPLEKLIKEAINLAENGFLVYEDLERAIEKAYPNMDNNMRSIFAPQAKLLRKGDRLLQKDLAKALRLIAKKGSLPFYKGVIAKDLVKTMKKNQGLIRKKDLENYKVYTSSPIWSKYRKYRIATMPLPSSGIFLLSILKNLEDYNLKNLYNNNRSQYYQVLTSAMKEGFRFRAKYGGDDRFVKFPKLRKKLLGKTKEKKKQEKYETTHFSIVSKNGDAVSSTQSINYRFGARVMIPNWGIILNDTMDDFSLAPNHHNVYGLVGSDANSIQGNKTPLSSMSPSFVFEGDELRLAIGAPGGSQIVSAILQGIIHSLDLGMPVFASVARGRIHHQYKPDFLFAEKEAMSKAEIHDLKVRGVKLKIKKLRAKLFLVERIPKGKSHSLRGASDPRGDGVPMSEGNVPEKKKK